VRALLVAAAATVTAGVVAGTVVGARTSTGQIAFTNNKAIYVIGADGSGLRKVTRSPYSNGGIAWSRDGRLLAFTRYFKQTNCPEDQGRGDLYLIRSNGAGEQRLTSSGCMFSSPAHPAFAPKGRTLAFYDEKGIFLARPSAWKPRAVSDRGLFPSWAPDARRVVFEDGPTSEILDTITRKIAPLGPGGQPVWAHRGATIACVASSSQLWLTDPTGQHKTMLASKPHMDGLAWSPDDRWIAFSSSDAKNRSTAWVVPAAGGKVVKLGSGAFPAWASAGDMLSVDGDDGYLYLVKPDGTGRHRLTKGFGAAWNPAD
jgi:Tol biopolymer transport system component